MPDKENIAVVSDIYIFHESNDLKALMEKELFQHMTSHIMSRVKAL